MMIPTRILAVLLSIACLSPTLIAGEADDPVLATVGQIQIHASQVDRGIPPGTFGTSRRSARTQRLAQLVDGATLRQAILATGVTVDEAVVDTAFAEVTKKAPEPTCNCYSYRDYDDYLAQNLLTREDARTELWISTGLDLVVRREWDQSYPDQAARDILVRREGPALRAKIRRYWHIGCWPNPADLATSTPAAPGAILEKVQAARQRILAGADFATVAREVCADPEEAKRGGFAGLLAHEETSALGVEAKAVEQLPAGTLSEPIPSLGSYHLIRWEPLTDADVLDQVKNRFVEERKQTFVDRALRERKVTYQGDGKALAPKPTTTP